MNMRKFRISLKKFITSFRLVYLDVKIALRIFYISLVQKT